MPERIDPVELAAELVRCPSVTPADAGAIGLLQSLLSQEGFDCSRADRGGISNLFAKWSSGKNGRTFGFNGHTDVVPAGDPSDWSVDPFGAEIKDGLLWGRGAGDMKSGVAAFVSAAVDFARLGKPDCSIIIQITGDEEAVATDGTAALMDWMSERGERMDVCLVGEPTCQGALGDTIKIGRRGSLSVSVEVFGKQGHSAYPERSNNPLTATARLAERIAFAELDKGTADFGPTTLAITSIDTGNKANNVIPPKCRAAFNVRFSDLHSSASLIEWFGKRYEEIESEFGVKTVSSVHSTAESFVTSRGPFTDLVVGAVEAETGLTPTLSTTGGTSDARFIKDHCPVLEFGLIGDTIHQVDERVPVKDIRRLKSVYSRILNGYFAGE